MTAASTTKFIVDFESSHDEEWVSIETEAGDALLALADATAELRETAPDDQWWEDALGRPLEEGETFRPIQVTVDSGEDDEEVVVPS